MKVLPMEETALTMPELTELVKEGTVVLTRNSRPLLVVKDVSGSDWESVSLASHPRFMAVIEESRRAYQKAGGVGLGELRGKLGISKIAAKRVSEDRGQQFPVAQFPRYL